MQIINCIKSGLKKYFKTNRTRLFIIRTTLTFLFALIYNIGLSQSEEKIETGYFEVKNIDSSFSDFYLIFIQKGKENFTIYSERSIIVKGEKIKVNQTYYFELSRKIDSVGNEIPISAANYLDLIYFNKYRGEEIGKLCIAKDLTGLIITHSKDNN